MTLILRGHELIDAPGRVAYRGDRTSGAIFSPCENYRYLLWRIFSSGPQLFGGEPRQMRAVAFIGLNPSTADERNDDNTIRRCISYAKDWGFDSLIMLNLFSYRATKPPDMKRQIDPGGCGLNLTVIQAVMQEADGIVCAWGADGAWQGQSETVLTILRQSSRPVWYLDKTASGEPRHPLYLRKDCERKPLFEAKGRSDDRFAAEIPRGQALSSVEDRGDDASAPKLRGTVRRGSLGIAGERSGGD
jgi:hypothetical protein